MGRVWVVVLLLARETGGQVQEGGGGRGGGGAQPPPPTTPTDPAPPPVPAVNCDAGHVYDPDAASCESCAAGRYASEGWEECTDCPPGRYGDAAIDGAISEEFGCPNLCQPGTFSAVVGAINATACLLCQPGQFATDVGSSNCDGECSAGKFSATRGSSSASDCIDCEAGKYDPDGRARTPCQMCPSGRYSNVVGASACAGSCEPGAFAPAGSTDVSACELCSAGKYDHDSNAGSPCTPCAPGTYSDDEGRTLNCYACPVNCGSAAGSTSIQDCSPTIALPWAPCASSACEVPPGHVPWTYKWIDIKRGGYTITSDDWQDLSPPSLPPPPGIEGGDGGGGPDGGRRMQGGGGGGSGQSGAIGQQQVAPPPPRTEGYFHYELPFEFPFFDLSESNITICTEGFIVFGAPGAPLLLTEAPATFVASPMEEGAADAMVAAYWMDFDPEGGAVYVQGDADMVVVTWESVTYTNDRRVYSPMQGSTFQVILLPVGDIVLQYKMLGRQESAPEELVVGFQNRGASFARTICSDVGSSSCPKGNTAFVMYTHGANYTWSDGCSMCPIGYKLSDDELNYEDVDECANNNGYCDPLATGHPTLPGNNFPSCANNVGSYSCGECPEGFLGVSSFDKEDGSGGCFLPNASDLSTGEAPVIPTAAVAIEVHSELLADDDSKAQFLGDATTTLSAALSVPEEEIWVDVVEPEMYSGGRRTLQPVAQALRVSVHSVDGPSKIAQLGVLLADNSSALWQTAVWLQQEQPDPFTVEYLCPSGKVRADGATACAPCFPPQFTPDARKCIDCPIYQTPTAQGNACECQAGYFNAELIRPSCNPLSFLGVRAGDEMFQCWSCEDMECVENCQGDVVNIKEGWTTLGEPGRDQAIYACKHAAACPGGSIASSRLIDCVDGYDSTLCGICSTNHTMKDDGSCQQCPQSTGDVLETLVVVAIVLLVLVIIIKTAPIWWNYFTMLQDIVALIYELHIEVILKIMVSTLQIVGNLAAVLGVELPQAVNDFLDTYVSWIKLDFVSMFKLGCLSSDGYVSSLMTNVGLVVVIGFIFAALYMFQIRKVDSHYIADDEQSREALRQVYDQFSDGKDLDQEQLCNAVSKIDATLSNQNLAAIFAKADADKTGTISFDSFCASIRSGSAGTVDEPSLRAVVLTQKVAEITNSTVDRAFLLVFIVYPALTNKIFEAFSCRDFGHGGSVLEVDYEMSCDSATYTKVLFAAIVLLMLWPIGIPLGIFVAMFRSREAILAEDEGTLAYFAPMIGDYKIAYYYWEVVELGRKLLLTGLIGVIGRGTIAQSVAATSITFVFFALAFKHQPYEDPALNFIKIVSELQIFGLLLICVVLQTNAQGFSGEIVTIEDYGSMQLWLIISIVPISVYMVATGVMGLREGEEAGGEDSDSRSSGKDRDIFEGVENPVGLGNRDNL